MSFCCELQIPSGPVTPMSMSVPAGFWGESSNNWDTSAGGYTSETLTCCEAEANLRAVGCRDQGEV